jgi:hypothetical protein
MGFVTFSEQGITVSETTNKFPNRVLKHGKVVLLDSREGLMVGGNQTLKIHGSQTSTEHIVGHSKYSQTYSRSFFEQKIYAQVYEPKLLSTNITELRGHEFYYHSGIIRQEFITHCALNSDFLRDHLLKLERLDLLNDTKYNAILPLLCPTLKNLIAKLNL